MNGETGYIAENLSVYHCGDVDACKTAILKPELAHVSTGIGFLKCIIGRIHSEEVKKKISVLSSQ